MRVTAAARARMSYPEGEELARCVAVTLAAERERVLAPFLALADSYGRWPFRVDPLGVTRRIDAVVDRIRHAAEG